MTGILWKLWLLTDGYCMWLRYSYDHQQAISASFRCGFGQSTPGKTYQALCRKCLRDSQHTESMLSHMIFEYCHCLSNAKGRNRTGTRWCTLIILQHLCFYSSSAGTSWMMSSKLSPLRRIWRWIHKIRSCIPIKRHWNVCPGAEKRMRNTEAISWTAFRRFSSPGIKDMSGYGPPSGCRIRLANRYEKRFIRCFRRASSPPLYTAGFSELRFLPDLKECSLA